MNRTKTIIETKELTYCKGKHNKFYILTLEKDYLGYTVMSHYGRIGYKGTTSKRGIFNYKTEALIRFNNIVKQKINKGYLPSSKKEIKSKGNFDKAEDVHIIRV